MPRRIALLACLILIAASAASSAAEAQSFDDACAAASPSAAVCIGGQKLAELGTATCRDNGGPDEACGAVPAGRYAAAAELEAYAGSWLHRTAGFQFALGDQVPLRDAQWLGTHNSFNANAAGPTLSHTDSNQQLTITQQLDADIRSLELDLHYVNGTEAGLGTKVVRVCHGRSGAEMHAGCTNEALFEDVAPEIGAWLAKHPDQVVLLYLEDHLGETSGYEEATSVLDAALPGMLYQPTTPPSDGCRQLPLEISRADVLAAGKQVVAVGNCRAGWNTHVFGWDATHVESGNSTGYSCASPFKPADYAAKLVRFFEDATWLSATTNASASPAAHEAGSLTPEKVGAMTACGVNLLGLDQFEPGDGRVAASIWSWADGEPRRENGACTVMGADGRWRAAACEAARPVACRVEGTLVLRPDAASCEGTLDLPRTGEENARLRALAAGTEVELAVL